MKRYLLLNKNNGRYYCVDYGWRDEDQTISLMTKAKILSLLSTTEERLSETCKRNGFRVIEIKMPGNV